MITIYTDGSSLGNPGPWGRGVIIIGEEQTWEDGASRQRKKTFVGGEPHTTNNRMELTAVIQALQFLHENLLAEKEIGIHMDSMYVRDGIEKHLDAWVRRGRKLANKKPVLNQDLRSKIYELRPAFSNIQRLRVKAHAYDPLNNEVDKLARGEAERIQASLPAGYVGEIGGRVEENVDGGLFG